ncbi:putative Nudix hydrolase NudL [Marinomonas aquimarina]|uniref:Putative Nudix hydrolase NudL n=1 Tax=Marinomonas aquimarina TaxID=295068 RepID=A0A1A8T4L1_9GAMM|nr:CoA pyrophosphatase [Marinomonas aquimarina]SBS26445.1 putative Nudix hydrolase NudL [Marinomonas aquimarina]
MVDVSTFLESPPITPTIDEIRAALDNETSAQIFNPDQHIAPHAYRHDYRAAAVLIPIYHCPDEGELKVLLTQRSLHMRNHPGQIAFPGGKHDPEDASIQYTALRETLEEVGLAPDCFELLGELGEYCSISGFCIKPVVAEMTRMSELSISEDEVERIHWVPLNHLLNPQNFSYVEREIGNLKRGYFEIDYHGLRIWGVTAGIIFGLYQAIENHSRR